MQQISQLQHHSLLEFASIQPPATFMTWTCKTLKRRHCHCRLKVTSVKAINCGHLPSYPLIKTSNHRQIPITILHSIITGEKRGKITHASNALSQIFGKHQRQTFEQNQPKLSSSSIIPLQKWAPTLMYFASKGLQMAVHTPFMLHVDRKFA